LEFNVPFQHKYGYIRDEYEDFTTNLLLSLQVKECWIFGEVRQYGDGAGNAIEKNSSVFSLISVS